MNRVIITMLALLTALWCSAQQEWTLKDCIDYAVGHNIEIKQVELQKENQELQLKSSKMAYLPNLNANIGQNFSFGRATGNDNVIVNQSLANTGFNVGTNIPVFTGLRNLNQIKSDKLNLQAVVGDLDKAKEDLSLNVTAYYLQVLYTKALVGVADEQKQLSQQQVDRTKILVDNGRLPESDWYDAMAQLAVDNQSLTEANNNYQLAKLSLCQLLNYEDLENFNVANLPTTDVTGSDERLISSPQQAYNYSEKNRPDIVAANYRLESSKRDVRIAQSAYYPELTLSASYGTGYYHNYNFENMAFGQQLKNNGSETVALSLSIPIFNRMATTYRVRQAKVSTVNRSLEIDLAKQKLLKEIQNAYYNAVAAKDKYAAAKETADASKVAFTMAEKKYYAGSSTAFDYSSAKTRLQKAQVEAVNAQYEYILRRKIFEFYNGTSLVS